MKTIFTALILFVLSALNAQNEFFVHKATASTTQGGNATLIDHPYLNNNPNAYFVVSHAWNPPGGSSVYNNKINGLYYSASDGKWLIYNQDNSSFILDASFFVYIPPVGWGAEFTVTDANSDGNYAYLDYSGTNDNPDAVIVINPIYTTYIDKNVGLWYNGSKWALYNEGNTGINVGQKFMISMAASNQVEYKHQSAATNIQDNWTIIDHPLLNDNPNAKFVFTHNWGAAGSSSNVLYDKVPGAWYDGSRWCIYNEDLTPFAENLTFNLIIDATTMGVEDAELTKTTVFPNPMNNEINFNSKNIIQEIRIYNMTGQELINTKANTNTIKLDVSKLPSGIYVATIKTDKGVETQKLIKK